MKDVRGDDDEEDRVIQLRNMVRFEVSLSFRVNDERLCNGSRGGEKLLGSCRLNQVKVCTVTNSQGVAKCLARFVCVCACVLPSHVYQ